MKIKYLLFSIMLGAFSTSYIAAGSVPAKKEIAPVLKRMYEKFVADKLTPAIKAGSVDAALRKEADELAHRLRSAGGQQEAQALEDLINPQGKPKEEAKKSEHPAEEKRKVDEEKVPVALTKVPVHINTIGQEYENARDEEINLDEDTDTFSAETFGEILARQKEHNNPMFIVRVVTHNPNGTSNVHYFDAYMFNAYRFGNNYSFFKTLQIVKQNDPLNRLPIVEARYFSLDPNNPAAGFTYQFSENTVINDRQKRAQIDKDQNLDPERKENAQKYLAGELVEEPIPQREEVLLPPDMFDGAADFFPGLLTDAFRNEILETLATSNDPSVRGPALLRLAHRHVDIAQQIPYYELATQEPTTPQAKAEGNAWLGEIYYRKHEYDRALVYLNRAAAQNDNFRMKADSQYRLGQMYLNGLGVVRDLGKAREYLTAAANQTASPWASSGAKPKLFELEHVARTEQEKELKHAMAESAKLADQKEKELNARVAAFQPTGKSDEELIREAVEKSVQEKEKADISLRRKKAIHDELLTLEDALQKNNMQPQLAKVKALLQAFDAKPYSVGLLQQALNTLQEIRVEKRIRFYGQQVALPGLLEPIRDTINKEIARLQL